MAHAVIVGGGPVGLLTSLVLARRGHTALVLEPDEGPPAGSADAVFDGWARPGVPQHVHGHIIRGRVGRVLHDEAPEVLAEMRATGVEPGDYDFGREQAGAVVPMARRPVFEAVLRRVAGRAPGVEIRPAHVAGLTARAEGATPRVTGVVTSAGESIEADLVLDCSGRRSAAPHWLRAIGVALPVDHYQACDLHYFARHYRLAPGARFPSRSFPNGDLTPYGVFLAVAEDNGTFCLAGGLSKTDPLRSAMRDGARFDRVLGALPSIAPWVQAGSPITEVQLMGGIANRRRSLLADGEPVVEGYVLLGDASLYTNATIGQGLALGFWQVAALAELSGLLGEDHRRLVQELEQWTDRTLGPRYRRQVTIDEAMVEGLRAGVAGAPMMHGGDELSALDALGRTGDAEAAAAFARVDNLLTDLPAELTDEALRRRVAGYLAGLPEGPAGPGPLPRPAFEAMLAA